MSGSLDMLRQRERPGYFIQPTTPPRDIASLSEAEINSYLRGFTFNPVPGGPTSSPYTAQDLRLELARRQPATRRNVGFELEDGSVAAPTATTTTTPAAPTTTTQEPARRTPPPAQAARPTEETPETFEAMRQFQAGLRNQQMQGGGGGQLSVLDMLRKRMARDLEDEPLQRVAEFGRGMLASGSPNFFTMLGAGAQAARQGDISRMDRLRQLAETERQQRALDVEEARRQEEIRVREQEQQLNAPLRAAQTRQALAYADYLRSGRGRGELRPGDILRIGENARRFALQQVPEPRPNSPEAIADTPERARLRQEERNRIIRAYTQAQYEAVGMEPPATTAGEPGAGTGGGGAAPDRVLPYAPPAPGAARTGPRIAPPQQ